MERILVIGCPGSGKSTFARALHAATGLPLCHLDLLFWNADKTNVPREEFLHRVQAVLDEERWIIDGHYASSLPLRLARCDTVIWLDLPLEDCLKGVAERTGRPRPDLPWIEETEDEEFLDYVRDFHIRQTPELPALLHAFPHITLHILRSHREADDFLAALAK